MQYKKKKHFIPFNMQFAALERFQMCCDQFELKKNEKYTINAVDFERISKLELKLRSH